MALAFTQIDRIHHNYLHGEMVAMGTLIQLVMEASKDTDKIARFFARVGLPVHMDQLSLSPKATDALDTIIEFALKNKNAHYMPTPVTAASLREAMLNANDLGLKISAELGDDAYRRVQGL